MREDLYKEMNEQENYYWWHIRKRRLVLNLINEIYKQPSSRDDHGKILDIGCGTGKMMEELKNIGEVYGADTSIEAINFCKQKGLQNLTLLKNDCLLPYPDSSMDIVLMLDVLEHIENVDAVLKEVNRVLKNNGFLIITVPAYQWLYSYWDVILHHKRRYNKQQLCLVLKDNFLNVVRISYFNSFALFPAIFYRVLKGKLSKKNIKSDFVDLPIIVNKILILLSNLELFILDRIDIQYGLSIFALVKK